MIVLRKKRKYHCQVLILTIFFFFWLFIISFNQCKFQRIPKTKCIRTGTENEHDQQKINRLTQGERKEWFQQKKKCLGRANCTNRQQGYPIHKERGHSIARIPRCHKWTRDSTIICYVPCRLLRTINPSQKQKCQTSLNAFVFGY